MSKRKRFESKINSTQDLDECARLYIKNIFKSYIKNPKVDIKKVVYTPSEPSDITIIDPTSNQLTKISTEDDLTEIIQKSWENPDTASSLFESVFETVKIVEENSDAKFKLNSNVIKPGAIVRVWNSLNRVDGSESHTVVTIDYKQRRVSFDTNNPPSIKVSLDGKQLPGVAHCISSPEPSFVKKLARVYFDNKKYFNSGLNKDKNSLAFTLKLKGIGKLTKENINILQEYLIENAINMNHNYISEVYTKHGDDYYAIQPIYRISTNLYYNKLSNTVFNTTKRIQFNITEDDITRGKIKGSIMKPINCSSFIELLFPNIIFRVNTVTLSMLANIKYIPTSPSMLRPAYNYTCLDTIDNDISDTPTSKNRKLELGPNVEYNYIKSSQVISWAKKKYGSLASYTAKASIALATFFIWALPYGIIASILTGSYLIIPLEYKTYFDSIKFDKILYDMQEVFSGALCKGFGFVRCDINTKTVPELKQKYGNKEISTFIKILELRKQKLTFKFNNSRRRKSAKKSRRRKSVKKSRRRKNY